MLVVETIGRIRREHFVKGKPIKEIMRELKVSRNTVRKVLRSGATSFEYTRAVQPRPKLGAWHGDLDCQSALKFDPRSASNRDPSEVVGSGLSR